MKLEVFERWTNLNRNLERVMVNLKHLESAEGLSRESIQTSIRDTEQLRVSINRYLAEMIEVDANKMQEILTPASSEENEKDE